MREANYLIPKTTNVTLPMNMQILLEQIEIDNSLGNDIEVKLVIEENRLVIKLKRGER